MDNKNAPLLLSRALGLKKIDDLTKLIRDLVLEPSRVREDAREAVLEFGDLEATHRQLLDTRARREHLERLPELDTAIKNSAQQLDIHTAEKNGLPVYIGEQAQQLWFSKIETIQKNLTELKEQMEQAEIAVSDGNNLVERRHEEYLSHGGDRIESLKKEIEYGKQQLQSIIREAARYQKKAKLLDLDEQLDKTVFTQNQTCITAGLTEAEAQIKKQQDEFADISGRWSDNRERLKTVGSELEEIRQRPDSNIPLKFQQLREELLNSLGLRKEQCLFIGELIDVKEKEKSWQGAVERALGGLRTTLAVAEESYSMVTRWLNKRHTGLHVRVQVVHTDSCKLDHHPTLKQDGFLQKLTWRDHPWQQWLQNHLNRFDLHCVTGTEELDRTPYSMTREGLIHRKSGFFEKKDLHKVDDRRHWSLGFSNKSMLATLEQDFKKLKREQIELDKSVNNARQSLDTCNDRKELWKNMQEFVWDNINLPYWKNKIAKLEEDLNILVSSGGDLDGVCQDSCHLFQFIFVLINARNVLRSSRMG